MQGWWRSFRERKGDLSLRKDDDTRYIPHAQMDAANEETINGG